MLNIEVKICASFKALLTTKEDTWGYCKYISCSRFLKIVNYPNYCDLYLTFLTHPLSNHISQILAC